MAHIDRHVGAAAFVLAGVVGSLVAFAAFVGISMFRNGWLFEYPLDDVYIHLAMAEQIANGGYGVNAGEYSSAASSPLYPFLLTPMAETPAQRWWPLLWNIAALFLSAALFGLAMARAGLGRIGILLTAAAPVALSMYITAFTGMENMAHTAASLAIVFGLWRYVETDRIGWVLVLGVLFAPAMRLEGLALALAAGATVIVLGRPRAGLGLMCLAILPVAIFVVFLLGLGLDPLPNSVVAKLADTGGQGPASKLAINAGSYGGRYLLVLSAVVLIIGAASLTTDRRRGYFALAVATAGFAHLAFGSTGWMDRYETYAIVSLVAALALVLSSASYLIRASAITAALVGGLFTYAPYALPVYAWNSAAIAGQHAEMARFAKAFVKGPVAVNDIGYVAWQNPHYVLDLWGLASAEALEARSSDASSGWAGPLAADKGVTAAMVYDKWLEDAVPSDWRRLGTLHLDVPNAFLGGPDVAFYATEQESVDTLRKALKAWEQGLPDRARFTYVEDGQ
ncbi:MAG: hypothetical protein RIE24_24410 [Silicimonas sp.]